jgi:DNA invertase Pin-like site-specific DNA recombinase
VPLTTFHRKLKNAIKHAQEAVARFYAETGEVPGQYADLLAGVEVPPEPTSPQVADELVLSTYRELGSIRKTARAVGISKSTVQRIINRAA